MTGVTGADGITFLDHTADVGIDVRAPSLELLFHRAAVGMLLLLHGRDDEDAEPRSAPADPGAGAGGGSGTGDPERAAGVGTRAVTLEADDTAALLADWLRELLFLHETRHADYAGATFDRLDADGLEARVRTEPAPRAVREIKGVTYHELAVEQTADGWTGRVIFDV